MATTTVVAWIGAVSGVSGLMWDFYKWKTSGPKLSVSVKPGMVIMERRKRPSEETLVVIRIQNIGTAPFSVPPRFKS
jgi:hypothetical protein